MTANAHSPESGAGSAVPAVPENSASTHADGSCLPLLASPGLPPPYQLRSAQPADVPAIVSLIRELAAFEQLSHWVETSDEALARHLFGEKPVAECWVVWDGAMPETGAIVAFALCFTSFSTFKCRPGLWLEDLYVVPEHRGKGLGQALIRYLASVAHERGYGRFEWSVLDWNANAISLYRKMGADILPDWRICRLTGDALKNLAAPDQA